MSNSEIRVCRICQEELNLETERDQVISPCNCTGSMSMVHIDCFSRWGRNRCEVCKFRFFAQEPPFVPAEAGAGMGMFNPHGPAPTVDQIYALTNQLPESVDGFEARRVVRDSLDMYFSQGAVSQTGLSIYFNFLREVCAWQNSSLLYLMGVTGGVSMVFGASFLSVPIMKGWYCLKRVRNSWKSLPTEGKVVAMSWLIIPVVGILGAMWFSEENTVAE